MSQTLPRAPLLAAWAGAWIRGEAALDDLLSGLGPEHQVVVAMPGTDGAEPLGLALGALRRAGATGFSAALPVPGDPIGLGGPVHFNAAAVDAGEAVLVEAVGLGLVPVQVGSAVEWRCSPAAAAPWVDLDEAALVLRQTLLDVTACLVALDVATWQPEIPDALMNLRHRPPPPLPRTYDGRRIETVERALLCLDIVDLARRVEPGAVTAMEADARRAALVDLDRAARRALVAACR
ncbi:hypothetical protein [Nocardioides terrisoli]|uniref:hypothetical protein n=1 Tax=Nocardioides terrisoli TaxID=3388267 RepID=UPI00287B6675|nr:hypothetical protein [Nocardioides marmorisolisilvae]